MSFVAVMSLAFSTPFRVDAVTVIAVPLVFSITVPFSFALLKSFVTPAGVAGSVVAAKIASANSASLANPALLAV